MPRISLLGRRTKPAAGGEAANVDARSDRYGNQFVVPISAGLYALADEGSYFKAINPTPDTGVASAVTAAFSATAALLTIRNTDAEGGKRLYIDFLRLIPSVVPATATRSEILVAVDNVSRYSSGGSAITPVNCNMDDATATIASVNFGAVVASAESAARRLARAQLSSVIPIVWEEYFLNFGAQDGEPGTLGGTAARRIGVPMPPVIIGGGDSAVFHVWHPGNAVTCASWEFELGWWER